MIRVRGATELARELRALLRGARRADDREEAERRGAGGSAPRSTDTPSSRGPVAPVVPSAADARAATRAQSSDQMTRSVSRTLRAATLGSSAIA